MNKYKKESLINEIIGILIIGIAIAIMRLSKSLDALVFILIIIGGGFIYVGYRLSEYKGAKKNE